MRNKSTPGPGQITKKIFLAGNLGGTLLTRVPWFLLENLLHFSRLPRGDPDEGPLMGTPHQIGGGKREERPGRILAGRELDLSTLSLSSETCFQSSDWIRLGPAPLAYACAALGRYRGLFRFLVLARKRIVWWKSNSFSKILAFYELDLNFIQVFLFSCNYDCIMHC